MLISNIRGGCKVHPASGIQQAGAPGWECPLLFKSTVLRQVLSYFMYTLVVVLPCLRM